VEAGGVTRWLQNAEIQEGYVVIGSSCQEEQCWRPFSGMHCRLNFYFAIAELFV
jgi:hypothetical protein